MVGRDVNSFPTQYRTWVVSDYPDFQGHFYTGLKSGSSPLEDIVAYEIQNDGYVVDFNLPDPINWTPARATMPAALIDSQLAILDGYAYLFGGIESDKIYQMDLNRPAVWWDTGARLPMVLGGSCFAIIDETMYLFGGVGGEDGYAKDVIFSAPVNDPLNWSDTGATLPEEVQKQQLAIVGNYVYLFSGLDINHARDFIWRAPLSNPLDWEDTGQVLPRPLYASRIAIMNGRLYLLGGQVFDNAPLGTILSASLSDPLTWIAEDAFMPGNCCEGQFLTIGDYGYLYTQAEIEDIQPYLTRIFRCKLSEPTIWEDVGVLPGDLHESQFGIIYDRIWAFGGNGISAIFTCNQILKYNTSNQKAIAYGNVTRTQFNSITNPNLKTQLLGFPYWKTNYGS